MPETFQRPRSMIEGPLNDVEHLLVAVCEMAIHAVSDDIGDLNRTTRFAVHEQRHIGIRPHRRRRLLDRAAVCAPSMRQLPQALLGARLAISNGQALVGAVAARLRPQEEVAARKDILETKLKRGAGGTLCGHDSGEGQSGLEAEARGFRNQPGGRDQRLASRLPRHLAPRGPPARANVIRVNLGPSRGLWKTLGNRLYGLSHIPYVMLVHQEPSDDHMLIAGVPGGVKVEEKHVKAKKAGG